VHNIFDPREFGVEPHQLKCHCGKPLHAAKHRADPDGVQRDRFAATTNGSLGLTKLVTWGAPECLRKVQLAGIFMCNRKTGEYSIDAICRRLRGLDGGIQFGSRVMTKRKRGKRKAEFFTFGAATPTMPEALIEQILDNGCFEKTFEANLARDWRIIEKEVRPALQRLRDNLAAATKGYHDAIAAVRQMTKLSASAGAWSIPWAHHHP
jgi:hypothetical protein